METDVMIIGRRFRAELRADDGGRKPRAEAVSAPADLCSPGERLFIVFRIDDVRFREPLRTEQTRAASTSAFRCRQSGTVRRGPLRARGDLWK